MEYIYPTTAIIDTNPTDPTIPSPENKPFTLAPLPLKTCTPALVPFVPPSPALPTVADDGALPVTDPNGPLDPNAPIITPPNPTPPPLLCSAIVFDPITTDPALLSDTSVPPSVMPEAPGVNVVPAIAIP